MTRYLENFELSQMMGGVSIAKSKCCVNRRSALGDIFMQPLLNSLNRQGELVSMDSM
jgi:hypothetical protein